jgi:hypothetical protein
VLRVFTQPRRFWALTASGQPSSLDEQFACRESRRVGGKGLTAGSCSCELGLLDSNTVGNDTECGALAAKASPALA